MEKPHPKNILYALWFCKELRVEHFVVEKTYHFVSIIGIQKNDLYIQAFCPNSFQDIVDAYGNDRGIPKIVKQTTKEFSSKNEFEIFVENHPIAIDFSIDWDNL